MEGCTSVIGASARLNLKDPDTWNVTIRIDPTPKRVLSGNRLQDLEFISDPRLSHSQSATETNDANILLCKIKSFHPWTGSRLRTKAEVLKPYDFRVLVGHDQPPEPTKRRAWFGRKTLKQSVSEPIDQSTTAGRSYICVSYNWWSDQWLRSGKGEGFGLSRSLYYDDHSENPESAFPIAEAMWNALLAERESQAEGIWIDQLCIDQKNESEVKNALLVAERVYRTARKVIVPLENVLLYDDEARAILDYVRAINNIPIHKRKSWNQWIKSPELYVIGASAYAVTKIFGSRWFRRIWCNHEMRMGSDFLFMVPIVERSAFGMHRENAHIMKLDCKALATLGESFRTIHQGTGMHPDDITRQSYFRLIQTEYNKDKQPRSIMPIKAAAPDLYSVIHFRRLLCKAVGISDPPCPIMRTLNELVAYGTQNPQDMFHVLLDEMASGLVYANESKPPSFPLVVYMVNIIAIASGDLSPLIMPTRSTLWREHIIEGLPQSAYSWAASPSSEMLPFGSPKRLRQTPDLKVTDLGLQLPVILVGYPAEMNVVQLSSIPSELESRTRKFVKTILQYNQSALRHERFSAIKQRLDVPLPLGVSSEYSPNGHYVRNFADAMVLISTFDRRWMVDRHTELHEIGLVAEGVDILEQHDSFHSLPILNDLQVGQYNDNDNAESESYKQYLERWSKFRHYLAFIEALVLFLTTPEGFYDSKSHLDEHLRISAIHNSAADGTKWSQLVTLPDEQTTQDYCLVRPKILHHYGRPNFVQYSGIDLRVGGLWAVVPIHMRSNAGEVIEPLDDHRAMSLDIWNDGNNSRGLKDEEVKRRAEEMLEVRLLNRNLRIFPTGEWHQAIYEKIAIVHG